MKRFGVVPASVLVLILMMGVSTGCQNELPNASARNAASAESAAVAEKATVEIAEAAAEAAAAETTGHDGTQPAAVAPSAGESSGLTREFFTGQKFKLVAVNGADLIGDAAASVPTLVFGEDFKISGKVCNTFSGPGKLENGRLTVKPLISTRMACLNESLGQLETLVTNLLENGADLSMNGTSLYLRHGDTTLRYEADLTE